MCRREAECNPGAGKGLGMVGNGSSSAFSLLTASMRSSIISRTLSVMVSGSAWAAAASSFVDVLMAVSVVGPLSISPNFRLQRGRVRPAAAWRWQMSICTVRVLCAFFGSEFVAYLAVDDAKVAECTFAATRIGNDAENVYGKFDKAVAAG